MRSLSKLLLQHTNPPELKNDSFRDFITSKKLLSWLDNSLQLTKDRFYSQALTFSTRICLHDLIFKVLMVSYKIIQKMENSRLSPNFDQSYPSQLEGLGSSLIKIRSL